MALSLISAAPGPSSLITWPPLLRSPPQSHNFQKVPADTLWFWQELMPCPGSKIQGSSTSTTETDGYGSRTAGHAPYSLEVVKKTFQHVKFPWPGYLTKVAKQGRPQCWLCAGTVSISSPLPPGFCLTWEACWDLGGRVPGPAAPWENVQVPGPGSHKPVLTFWGFFWALHQVHDVLCDWGEGLAQR